MSSLPLFLSPYIYLFLFLITFTFFISISIYFSFSPFNFSFPSTFLSRLLFLSPYISLSFYLSIFFSFSVSISLYFSEGVMVKALDSRIVVREFELQSCYYAHFQINTLGKGMTPPTDPPMYGLDSILLSF